MRIKKVVRATAFCIVLILFLNHCYDVFSWKDTAGDYTSSMESFYNLDEDLVDVLFLGSSRCYCSINNSVLWKEQGIRSFSLSVSGQDLSSSYHCMVESLKTQTPEVVCLELYGVNFHGYAVESNLYRNVLGYKYSINAFNAAKSMAEDRMGELLLRWPIVHTRYRELQKRDFVKDRPVYLGYQTGFVTNPVGGLSSYNGTEQIKIAEEEEKWIRKIIALAEEEDIELCFFVAPATYTEEDDKRLNYVEAIASEHGIPVLNFAKMQEELRLDLNTDFCDWAHTNYYGAQKVSSFMANFLIQNYDIEDRRGQEGSQLWEEDAKVREHEFRAQQLKLTGDRQDYLNLISGVEDYTIIVSSSGQYLSGANFEEYEATLGLEGFYEGSGVWVIQNQKNVFSSGTGDFWKHMELEDSDLVMTGNAGVTAVVIDRQSYQKVYDGVNLIVYDNLLKKVVDVVGLEGNEQYGMWR